MQLYALVPYILKTFLSLKKKKRGESKNVSCLLCEEEGPAFWCWWFCHQAVAHPFVSICFTNRRRGKSVQRS